ncbi:MAG: mechanosensitive ion channel family protein [Desulfovibrionaceae bacterium]
MQQTDTSVFSMLMTALALGIIALAAAWLLRRTLLRAARRWAYKPTTPIEPDRYDALEGATTPLLFLGLLYLGLHAVLPHWAQLDLMRKGFLLLSTFYGARLAALLAAFALELYLRRRSVEGLDSGARAALPIIKSIIWVLALAFLMDNLGFQVTAIVTGLGIAGVAVGLAGQAILGDLFSYVAILFDRPFEIDDFIITGDVMGTVEHVGLKTTRLRSLGGELIVCANSDLTNSRVRNYKRMEERRVLFTLGVTYQTGADVLETLPGEVRTIIEAAPMTRFDRAHFKEYGDSALVFECVYYVLSKEYNDYMDVQQAINFAIKRRFETLGVEFAYPTRTLFLVNQPG